MRPELIKAAELLRRNTPEAIGEAIGLLQNTVYSFSMKVCGHPEDAEDTMQEVPLSLDGTPGQNSGPASSRGLAVYSYQKPLLAYAPKGSLSPKAYAVVG